jgi:hypothetical protein
VAVIRDRGYCVVRHCHDDTDWLNYLKLLHYVLRVGLRRVLSRLLSVLRGVLRYAHRWVLLSVLKWVLLSVLRWVLLSVLRRVLLRMLLRVLLRVRLRRIARRLMHILQDLSVQRRRLIAWMLTAGWRMLRSGCLGLTYLLLCKA